MTSEPKRSRARRVLGVIGSVVGVTVTFVAATATAAVIHLDLPATRRLVATQVNGILESNLAGKVQIERIAGLGLGGVEGVRVRVHDPEGVQVLHVDDVRVHIRAIDAARSALFGDGPILIDIPSASIGNVDANLDADRAGNLRIANAFASRKPPEPKKPNEPPGRGVRVEAPVLRLTHAWVHGTPPGAPLVDADLSGLEASAHVDPSVMRADLERVRLVTRSLPRGVDPRGTIGGKLAIPAPNGQGMDVQAIFDGHIGGVPTTAQARMNDRRIDARIDALDPTGAQTSAVVNEIAIRDPISVHAEAHGDLPRIEGQAKILLGKASVEANAVVVTSTTTQIKGAVSARNVDVSAVSPGGPQTNVGLDARADLEIGEDGIRGEAALDTLPGTIDQQEIPRLEARGRFEGKAAQVRARIHEKTMPTEVAVDLVPRDGVPDAQVLTAAVRSRIPDLHRVPKVGTRFGGSAAVDASARMLLPEKELESAEVKVVLEKVKDTQLSIGRLEAKARAQGTIDRPAIDAEVHGSQLLTGALPLASLDARARIEMVEKAVTIRDAKVDAERVADEKISASARVVRIQGPSLRVEGAELRGVGDPVRAELSKDAREVRARIDAPRIDVPLVARIAGKKDELGIRRGRLGLQGEAVLRNGVAKGKVHAELHDFAMRDVKRAGALVVDASIDGREVALDVGADIGDAGKLRLHTDRVVIDGRVDDPRAWRRAAGRVHLEGEVDMEQAAALLPADALPVADVRGLLTVQGRVGRDAPDAPPELYLHAHTNGLVVAAPPGPTEHVGGLEVTGPPRWRSADLDIGLDVRNDGPSGLTDVAFRATDRHGAVVALNVKSIVPYAELAADPARARERLVTAPVEAKLVVPPRRLDQLPSILGVKDLQGAMEAQLDLSGTVLDPNLRLVARTRGVRTPALQADMKADADVSFDYDGRIAGLSAKVRARGHDLLDAGARVEARARDLVNGGADGAPWNASGHVRLASFPLETVPQLADRYIRGRVSGELTLADLHEDARLKGRLELEGLGVGKAEYTKGIVTLDAGDGKFAAKVRLDQADGYLDATLSNGLVWGGEIAPKLDTSRPLEAKLVAQSFRAAAIQPFVQSAVPTLDGRIEANATARIVPGRPGAEVQGNVRFHDGIVQLAALGEELRGVRASVALTPDGMVRVTDVHAKGTQGEVSADAQVKLDGMRIADATANIGIPQRSPLALAVQGQPIGQISGAIKVKASQSPDARETFVSVDVPKMNVELPQAMKSGVQTLEEKENIRVGVYRGGNKFVELPLEKADLRPVTDEQDEGEATRLDVDVRLGKITIERGNQLAVHLTGNPKVLIEGGETKLDGQIRVDGGWVDLQGKKFEIEKGTVTFTGQTPPNPVVVATAGWTAADGSRVYADFVGPVKTGRVNLRSEPPRPKNEILALVLFGTADGANPRPPPPGSRSDGTTKAAVGLGGGFVAQGLTEALDDLAGIQATARIDTTRSNNPRPEVELQLSPRVSIGFAHVIGTPPITEPDKNLANVEYRFHRNWSLETTFGDRGTALLDALWQKRY